MSCGCKDKTNKKKKEQTPVEEPVLQVQQDTSLTIEQIQEVHNLLHAINTSPGARNVLIPFIERYLGEKVINYCDQICQKRLESKFNALKKQIK